MGVPRRSLWARGLRRLQRRRFRRRPVSWPDPVWLDLFYDLAFAAAIIAVSGILAADASPQSLLWATTVYGTLGCAWLLKGAATGAFAQERPPVRPAMVVLSIVQMAAILLLAVSSGDSIADRRGLVSLLLAAVLACGLALALLPQVGGRAAGREQYPLLTAGAAVLFLLSALLGTTLSLIAWLLALVALVRAALSCVQASSIQTPRYVHRVGELTLIITGEVLVKLVLVAKEQTIWSVRLSALVPVLVIVVVAWWAYFTGPVETRQLSARARALWAGAHLPLHVGLLGIAVGLAKIVVDRNALNGDGAAFGLMLGPGALIVAALAALDAIDGDRRGARIFAVAALLALAGCGGLLVADVSTTTVAAVLAAALVIATGLARAAPTADGAAA